MTMKSKKASEYGWIVKIPATGIVQLVGVKPTVYTSMDFPDEMRERISLSEFFLPGSDRTYLLAYSRHGEAAGLPRNRIASWSMRNNRVKHAGETIFGDAVVFRAEAGKLMPLDPVEALRIRKEIRQTETMEAWGTK